ALSELVRLLPEQAEQIIACVSSEEPSLIDQREESWQLLALRSAANREQPHAVLKQRPRDTLALVGLMVDDLLLPDKISFRHSDRQLVGRLPDRGKGRPEVFG